MLVVMKTRISILFFLIFVPLSVNAQMFAVEAGYVPNPYLVHPQAWNTRTKSFVGRLPAIICSTHEPMFTPHVLPLAVSTPVIGFAPARFSLKWW